MGKYLTLQLQRVSEKIEKDQTIERPKCNKLKYRLPVFRHGLFILIFFL